MDGILARQIVHAPADLLGQNGRIGIRGSASIRWEDEEEQPMDHQGHGGHEMGQHSHDSGDQGQGAHAAHGAPAMDRGGNVDHTGHEAMFRRRFWVSTLLSIPVLLFSPFIQQTLSFRMPEVPGGSWITPLFAVIVFGYGGLPFLRMALPELRNRRPGMMMLISLNNIVDFVYSLVALFIGGDTFFWELVPLVDIMLLGHWLEMRSVRQASGALNELARLMPDTAERVSGDGQTETVPASEWAVGDLVLVRPGASVPADGVVEQGDSELNEAMITGESRPGRKGQGDAVITGTLNGE